MMKYFLLPFVIAGLIIFSPTVKAEDAATTDQAPINDVKATIDKLVQAVEQFPGDQNLKARRVKLREIITPKFDFNQMARLSMGAYWKDLSSQDQNDFVATFSDLLARTYLARIENIKADTVKVDGQNFSNPNQVVVNTTVTHKGDKFPINYRLVKGDGGWKVYDVVIENVGLVVNYRNEFSGIMRKEQFAGLMKRLKDKEAKMES